MHNGYIKLFRKMITTSFYKKPLVSHLACHLLLKANHKSIKIIFNNQEMELKEGDLITGRKILSEETGLTEQEIRTSINILRNVGFLTSESTNRFTLIHLLKYSNYQRDKTKSTNKLTNKQPTSNQQVTTDKNDKKERITPITPGPLQDTRQDEFNNFKTEIAIAWNELAVRRKLSPVRFISGEREKRLFRRFKDKDFMANWKEALKNSENCPFYFGNNDRKWKMNFDFILRQNGKKEDNWLNMLEGKYKGFGG